MKKQRLITKTLYIAVEIFDRELGGALLLASYAASRGWKVVVGGKQAIFNNMSRFREMPGVFFLKSIVPGETFKQKEIASYGHKVVSLDVEALVPSNGKAGVGLRYSKESIELADLIYFWGEKHYNSVYSVYPEIKSKSIITGSPIVDEIILRKNNRPKRRINHIKILVGTSCAYANHLNGIDFALRMSRCAFGNNLGEKERREIENEALLDKKIFEFWKEIILKLASEFKTCEIVLRPHPSENKEFWRTYIRNLKNVRIDENTPILDEMINSDVYIHFNSTSSMISNILEIPTFMLLPKLNTNLLDRITFVKDLSITASSCDHLIKKIKECVENPEKTYVRKDLSQYCINLTSEKFSSSELIIDSLEKRFDFLESHGNILKRSFQEYLYVKMKKTKFFILWVFGIIFSLLNIQAKKYVLPKNAYKNARAKQPITSLKTINKKMSNFTKVQTDSNIIARQIQKNLFVIKKIFERI